MNAPSPFRFAPASQHLESMRVSWNPPMGRLTYAASPEPAHEASRTLSVARWFLGESPPPRTSSGAAPRRARELVIDGRAFYGSVTMNDATHPQSLALRQSILDRKRAVIEFANF